MILDFFQYLQKHLKEGALPGRKAQLKMSPVPPEADDPMRAREAPADAQPSSVLILLFPNDDGKPELVLTLRTQNINHAGQLSFPGGRSEPGESSVETALREAEEEVGINPQKVQIAGQLSSLYVPHSNNNVKPVVGFLKYEPHFSINPIEVEEVFTVELDELLKKENQTTENWQLHDETIYRVPFWDLHRVPLWGVTAMILSEFLELYKEFKDRAH